MTFSARAAIANDDALLQRVAACAAGNPSVYENDGHPVAWANTNAWRLAAREGWGEAYADGGGDAITDEMIDAAVSALIGGAA